MFYLLNCSGVACKENKTPGASRHQTPRRAIPRRPPPCSFARRAVEGSAGPQTPGDNADAGRWGPPRLQLTSAEMNGSRHVARTSPKTRLWPLSGFSKRLLASPATRRRPPALTRLRTHVAGELLRWVLAPLADQRLLGRQEIGAALRVGAMPRRDWPPLVAPAFLWTRDHLVRSQEQ